MLCLAGRASEKLWSLAGDPGFEHSRRLVGGENKVCFRCSNGSAGSCCCDDLDTLPARSCSCNSPGCLLGRDACVKRYARQRRSSRFARGLAFPPRAQ